MNAFNVPCSTSMCGCPACCRLVQLDGLGRDLDMLLCEKHKQEFLDQFSSNAIAMRAGSQQNPGIHRVEVVWIMESMARWFEICIMDKLGGQYIVPIVGYCDGAAILHFFLRRQLARPMTHQLMLQAITALGYTISSATIVRRYLVGTNEVFDAVLRIANEGHAIEIDSRPSDAVCLSILAGVPLFALAAVLDQPENLRS